MSELKELKIESRYSTEVKLSGLAKDFKEFITNNKFNLSGSDLSGSNLSGSDLSESNLSGSDLSGTKINPFSYRNISIILPENSKLESVKYSEIFIKIGCKEKTIKEWDKWFRSDEEFETKRDTFRFKQIYAHYRSVREYCKVLWGE